MELARILIDTSIVIEHLRKQNRRKSILYRIAGGGGASGGLGAVESTMERRAAIPGQGHLPPSLLRLSVGIEDAEDLWGDLEGAIREAAG